MFASVRLIFLRMSKPEGKQVTQPPSLYLPSSVGSDEVKRKRNYVSMWGPNKRRASIAVVGGPMVIVSAVVRLLRRGVAVFEEPSLYFELFETS